MPPRYSAKNPPQRVAKPQLPRNEKPGPLPTVEEVIQTTTATYKCLTCNHKNVSMYLETPHCVDCVTRNHESCSHCQTTIPPGYYHTYGEKHRFTCYQCTTYQYRAQDFSYGAAYNTMFPPLQINTTYPIDLGYYTNQHYYQQGDQLCDYNVAGPNGLESPDDMINSTLP